MGVLGGKGGFSAGPIGLADDLNNEVLVCSTGGNTQGGEGRKGVKKEGGSASNVLGQKALKLFSAGNFKKRQSTAQDNVKASY